MSMLRREGASSLLGPGPLWVPGSCIPRHSGAETSGAPASLPWLTPDRTEPTFTARPALPQPPRTPAWRQGERGSRQLWGAGAASGPCLRRVRWDRRPGRGRLVPESVEAAS